VSREDSRSKGGAAEKECPRNAPLARDPSEHRAVTGTADLPGSSRCPSRSKMPGVRVDGTTLLGCPCLRRVDSHSRRQGAPATYFLPPSPVEQLFEDVALDESREFEGAASGADENPGERE
jgi:hypothetical protein